VFKILLNMLRLVLLILYRFLFFLPWVLIDSVVEEEVQNMLCSQL